MWSGLDTGRGPAELKEGVRPGKSEKAEEVLFLTHFYRRGKRKPEVASPAGNHMRCKQSGGDSRPRWRSCPLALCLRAVCTEIIGVSRCHTSAG